MDVSNINNNLTNFLTTSTKETAEQNKFQEILKNAKNNQDSEELKEACEAFESYFLNQLFTEMRKTIPKSNLLDAATGRETYENMLYQEYADQIPKGKGTGIANMLYKQLSKT